MGLSRLRPDLRNNAARSYVYFSNSPICMVITEHCDTKAAEIPKVYFS